MHVLTFSREFPTYHPRAGEPTYFVEKIAKSLHTTGIRPFDIPDSVFHEQVYYLIEPKHHTIRAGHRFKAGDWFSPRVWSGQPYRSKQIIIAPPIQVKQVWNFEICDDGRIQIDGKTRFDPDFQFAESNKRLIEVASNDGLSVTDMLLWFKHPKPFTGQIICWNDKITY